MVNKDIIGMLEGSHAEKLVHCSQSCADAAIHLHKLCICIQKGQERLKENYAAGGVTYATPVKHHISPAATSL
jgi:hypothetical protein